MVFKPISHLARRSTKAFTHGYAQSLAAASQSSYASTNTNLGPFNNHRLANRGPTTRREAFFGTAASSNALTKDFSLFPTAGLHSEGASDAFFGIWSKTQPEEEIQPHAPRETGWKNAPSSRAKELRKLLGASPQAGERQSAPTQLTSDARHLSVTAGHRAAQTDPPPSQSSDATVSKTLQSDTSVTVAQDALDQPQTPTAPFRAKTEEANSELQPPYAQVQGPLDFSVSHTEPSIDPEGCANGAQSEHPYNQQILALAETGQYAAVPALFESVLSAGFVPTVQVYNALMKSAAALGASKLDSVPRVLNIYTDMLLRKIQPNSETYIVLLELLASRSIEVALLKSAHQQQLRRFGELSRESSLPSRSLEVDQAIINEDDTLRTALRLFKLATASSRTDRFLPTTYAALIDACAANEDVDNMIKIYAHMEQQKTPPLAAVYPPMIQAFAARGDLRSSVECYNEYKQLVSNETSDSPGLTDRLDAHVYAAVVGSYLRCGRESGARKFFSKINRTLAPYPEALQDARNVITLRAFILTYLEKENFQEALNFLDSESISSYTRDAALDMIAAAAADSSANSIAKLAFGCIADRSLSKNASLSILAMHLRRGDIESCCKSWADLRQLFEMDQTFVEPTVMYATALIRHASPAEALEQARQAFTDIRSSRNVPMEGRNTSDMIDESIERLHSALVEQGALDMPNTMTLLWTMMENGGLLIPVAEQVLASLGAQEVSMLDGEDLDLALYVGAGFVSADSVTLDVAHIERFAHLLRTALDKGATLCDRTIESITFALSRLETSHPTLAPLWSAFRQRLLMPPSPTLFGQSQRSSSVLPTPVVGDNFDPYAKDLDSRGSSIIVEGLDRTASHSATALNESLARFKNIRRVGRHPRYIAYAKLIGAAAKEGRSGLINDIYEMARHDVPLIPHLPAVHHGWTNIFDAMVGAYLTVGRRSLAAAYHEKLLEMGAAPTANTYGLYITTLKESSRTLDEASEAVKIFRRAKSEGVEPTSFLYNALIGKLGKARRIDDCLFYFAEMRARSIRPTSVTYGTIVNALCRVSDDRFAQDLFDEMESMPNYKPRPAPYNSMMQFFLSTKRDSSKVLEYYQRMQARGIKPTTHTYKLLIDTYATLEPINLAAAEGVLETIRSSGSSPEAIHYASLIHAKGCVLQDMQGAHETFQRVLKDSSVKPQPCLYQAYFESMVANHQVKGTSPVLEEMLASGIDMTPYIANTLIHGWTLDHDIDAAQAVYDSIRTEKREPSTYEVMTRGFLAAGQRGKAAKVVEEMWSRGYPSAVSGKIVELMNHQDSNEALSSLN